MLKKYKNEVILLFFLINISIFHMFISFHYSNSDLVNFNIPWAVAAAKHGFSCYSHVNIDYPPLFPLLLGVFGKFVNVALENGLDEKVLMWIKLIPILFNLLTSFVMYFVLKRYVTSDKSLIYTFLWSVMLILMFNSSYWGQADCLLLFFLLLMFFFLDRKKIMLSTLFFSLGCLTKLQMLYFFPFLLFYSLVHFNCKDVMKAFIFGLFVGILGWLPFIVANNNLFLPVEIYFGGYNKYQLINMNAANFWGLFRNLNFLDINSIFINIFNFNIKYSQIGLFAWFLIFILVITYFYLDNKKKLNHSVYALGFIYFGLIVMFTMKQHERYLIPMLLFAFLWSISRKKIIGIFLFQIFNLSLFAQQYILLVYGSAIHLNVLPIFSVINIVIFILFTIIFRYKKEDVG